MMLDLEGNRAPPMILDLEQQHFGPMLDMVKSLYVDQQKNGLDQLGHLTKSKKNAQLLLRTPHAMNAIVK